MKVYVDFDRTLFDCDRFLGDLYALVNKYNITKDMFKECQNQSRKYGFNPYIILSLVKDKIIVDDKLYDDIKNLINKAKEYLYSDTIPFLKYLKSLNYEVVILTKGNYEYQKEKIDNCSLESLYSELLVTLEHKGELSLDYKNSIFIDDNPKEILSIMKKKPKMIFRIVRDKALYSEELLDKSIPSYKSLDEIKKYFN